VSYFYNEQHFYLAGGVPTVTLTVIENESIYLRNVFSLPSTMNCDVVYPNGTREVLVSNSSPSSSNHWGKEGKLF
jgi:hypothetical protein